MRSIVLVHGAHVSVSAWDRVAAELRGRGHHVDAVELHRGSLTRDTAAVQEGVDAIGGPVLVCGWSYGGMVITGLDLVPGSHLVYLCALMPAEGDTASSLVEEHPTGFADLVQLDPSGELELTTDDIDQFMWPDASPDAAASARAMLQSQAIQPLVESPSRVAWRDVPSTYVVTTADRVVLPALQRRFAAQATDSVEWDTGHGPMVSRPDLVVDLLDALAGDEAAAS